MQKHYWPLSQIKGIHVYVHVHYIQEIGIDISCSSAILTFRKLTSIYKAIFVFIRPSLEELYVKYNSSKGHLYIQTYSEG
jgi:hypothetical protein